MDGRTKHVIKNNHYKLVFSILLCRSMCFKHVQTFGCSVISSLFYIVLKIFLDKSNLKVFFFPGALDTILHGPRLTQQRRHSVSVCQTPTSTVPPPLPPQPQKKISVSTEPDDEDSLRSSSSLCSSQRSLASGLSSPDVDISGYQLNTPAMHANLHTEFIHSVRIYHGHLTPVIRVISENYLTRLTPRQRRNDEARLAGLDYCS